MSATDNEVEKVAFVAPRMEARGTNEYVVHLASELLRRGVDVTVFCAPGPMLELLADEAINVETFERLGSRGLKGAERDRFVARLQKYGPQVIHAQTIPLAVLLGQMEAGAPVVLTLHAPPERPRALRSVLPDVAGIVATSQYVREELVNEYGVDKSSIWMIPNGIDVDALAKNPVRPIFQDGTPVIGCMGPVEKARGHELFVRAAAQIIKNGKNLQFVVGGEGEELPRLRRLSTELGLDECLTFVGDFSSYAEVLEALDVVVQSAQVQVSGFSILDAMARGRPVIAFNTGTACEIIDSEKTGLVVPMDDVDALVNAIERLAESPEKARRIGEAGRRAVAEEFNIRHTADSIMAVYRGLVG